MNIQIGMPTHPIVAEALRCSGEHRLIVKVSHTWDEAGWGRGTCGLGTVVHLQQSNIKHGRFRTIRAFRFACKGQVFMGRNAASASVARCSANQDILDVVRGTVRRTKRIVELSRRNWRSCEASEPNSPAVERRNTNDGKQRRRR
jgi:hypothetical protein